MNRKQLAAALLLAVAAPSPSHALFDLGNVGLPTGNPGIDPGDPLPPPPPLPPIGIQNVGLNFIEVAVRPPAGRTSQLLRQAPGGAFAPLRSLIAGVETAVRDENLALGKGYCYRIDISGGSQPDESHTRCATTDWRVGFESLVITQGESDRVLGLFDWRDTQALAEGTPDAPALYYMNLLIAPDDVEAVASASVAAAMEDPIAAAVDAYRWMGLHVQTSPLFPAELDGWNDAQGIARDCGPAGPVLGEIGPVAAMARTVRPVTTFQPGGTCVPVGRWAFAAVPGRIYNELRARMLEQIGRGETPGIRALVFRKVPVAAALAPGVARHVLNYVYLGQQGFEFNAIPRCWSNGDGTTTCQQFLLGWVLRKITHWVVELSDAVVEGVRSAIGRITRLVKGELRLDLNFRLLNTDPVFGTGELMRSGWSGETLHLSGVKVEVRQGLAAFYAHTDDQGYVTLTVAKNSDTKVCIQVENDTAEITEYLIEKTVCVANLGKLTDYTRRTVDVRHDYLNTLAAMTDARGYLLRTAGFEMPKITVLVGEQADGLAAAGRSFAPCMGRVPSLLGLGADLVGVLGSLLNPAFLATTTAIEFFYSVDIVLRTPDDGSRGVPVHEYGHAVMCEMLLQQGIDAFEMAWTDIILATSDQSAGSQASYLNEAFADFITEQVLGGTNYFAPGDFVASLHVNYCKAGTSCFDQNFDDQSSFEGQVARVVSILHDAFDGHPQGAGPNDGSHWLQAATDAPLAHVGAADSDLRDEAVSLPGVRLETLFEHWDDRGQLMREDNFLGGLADLLEAEGVSESDVCALFALHDPSRSCPSYVAARPWLGWLGTASASSDLLAAFAATPPPAPAPGVPIPYPNVATRPALVSAIASLQPAPVPAPAPAPGAEPEPADETCEACSAPVVFEGMQKIKVSGAGKDERETAFAFRLGQGAFEGIDPLGQLYQGAWDARNAKGSKLRLHLSPDYADALARLLAESAQSLGVDAASLRTTGPAKIELRLAKGGTLVGKISVAFEIEVDGRSRRGTYVAKLRGV